MWRTLYFWSMFTLMNNKINLMSPRWKFATGSHIQISNNTFVGWSMQTVAYMETFRYVKIVIPQSVRSLCLKQYFPPHKLQNNHAPERRQNNVWVVIKVQVSSTRPTCPHLTLTSPHNHATPVDGFETVQVNNHIKLWIKQAFIPLLWSRDTDAVIQGL